MVVSLLLIHFRLFDISCYGQKNITVSYIKLSNKLYILTTIGAAGNEEMNGPVLYIITCKIYFNWLRRVEMAGVGAG
jgi:hypothetical protein